MVLTIVPPFNLISYGSLPVPYCGNVQSSGDFIIANYIIAVTLGCVIAISLVYHD